MTSILTSELNVCKQIITINNKGKCILTFNDKSESVEGVSFRKIMKIIIR